MLLLLLLLSLARWRLAVPDCCRHRRLHAPLLLLISHDLLDLLRRQASCDSRWQTCHCAAVRGSGRRHGRHGMRRSLRTGDGAVRRGGIDGASGRASLTHHVGHHHGWSPQTRSGGWRLMKWRRRVSERLPALWLSRSICKCFGWRSW